MHSDQPPKAARLQHRARIASWCSRIIAFAIPLALAVSWVIGDAGTAAVAGLGLPKGHEVSPLQHALAAGLSLLPAMAMTMSLLSVATCFDGFARQDWFGARQPHALHQAGKWLVIAGALSFVMPTLLGLLLSANAPTGARVLVVTVSSQTVLALVFGALLWVLGDLWSVARRLASENAEFV